ncbi:MAG: hypothetical protein ABL967_01435 [Bryobacteraceae bacterium]
MSALSSPNQMIKGLAMLAKNVCSLLTFPFEMLLRPWFGSRYFHIILMALSLPCWQAICLASGIFGGRAYGAFALVIAIWCGCVYNGFRIWRLMLHPQQEKDSEREGDPIVELSSSWAIQRIVYEPLGILIAAILFKLIGIFNLILALCVAASAAALCLKNIITWYEAWTYLRDMLDQQGRIPIIQAISAGQPVPKSIGRFTLSSIPVGTSPKTQAVIASGLAGLTPEMEKLLSPVER